MSKPIKTYEDLLKEKQKLEVLLQAQAELVRYDFNEVKDAAIDSLAAVGKVFTRNTSNLVLTSATNRLVDVVLRKGILGRAGWVTRLVVPFLVKNYSSHYIASHKKQWMKKLFSWIGKKNQNGRHAPERESEDLSRE
jgi:hypothetical protein